VAYKLMFTVLVWACCFISLVVTPWGYKAGNRLYANLRPLARPPIVSSPPSLWLKKDRESDLETGERVVELTGRCSSFPSSPWHCRVGSRQRSCKSTCKNS
jgi:hypothetical protein